jgi:flavorubredoxin
MIINRDAGTTIDEIAPRVFRISIPFHPQQDDPGMTFNQYLIASDEPLLFHTGMRSTFPLVREAIESVIPVARLRWIGLSHFEADECGALNEFLSVAPDAIPLCGRVAAMTSIGDFAAREPRALADGETLTIGEHVLEWIDAPHLPHNWECGYLFDRTTGTLFCGDLLGQGGADRPALTSEDVAALAEEDRAAFAAVMPDYFSHSRNAGPIFERLIGTRPATLAIMHGSAWSDGSENGGADLLRRLAASFEQ